MTARPVALCTRHLPTGKTCAQPALRGERFCRFHNGARSRAIAERDERIFSLSRELDAMTIYRLLQTLHRELSAIRHVVGDRPAATLALVTAIRHLRQLNAEGFAITRNPRRSASSMPSTTKQQPQQNQ